MKRLFFSVSFLFILISTVNLAQGEIHDFAGFKKISLDTPKEYILPFIGEEYKLERLPDDIDETYFLTKEDTVECGYIQFKNDSLFQAVKVWDIMDIADAYEILFSLIVARRDYTLNPRYNIQPYINQYLGPFIKKTIAFKNVFDGYTINFEFDNRTGEVIITEVLSKLK